MKLSKTQICLYIYEELLSKGFIEISFYKNEFNLEDKTFMRYINELRSYLSNFYKGYEISYCRSTQTYKLVKYEENNKKK